MGEHKIHNINDDTLDKEIENTLTAASVWKGSPDGMWDSIKPELERGTKGWGKVRMWTAAAAAVLMVAVAIHYKPWEGMQDPKSQGGDTPQVTQGDTGETDIENPAPQAENPTGNQESNPGHKGPAPFYVNFSVTPSVNEVNPGDKITIDVSINAIEDGVELGSKEPRVRLWKFGETQGKPLEEIVLSEWRAIPVQKGKALSTTVTMDAPLEPGLYEVDMILDAKWGEYESNPSGNAVRIFVKYPEGSVRQGKIAVNKEVTLSGHTVKVKDIVMTEKNATINFYISKTPVPMVFDVSIITGDGRKLSVTGQSEKAHDGGGSVSTEFLPIPADADKIIFEVSNIGRYTNGNLATDPGPWKIEIPLKAE